MIDDYTQDMTQPATYWTRGENDGFGGTTGGTREPLMVRWEDKAILFRDASGNEVASSAVVYVPEPLEIGGHILLGESGESSPPPEAREIRQVQTSPSLDGSTQITKVIL